MGKLPLRITPLRSGRLVIPRQKEDKSLGDLLSFENLQHTGCEVIRLPRTDHERRSPRLQLAEDTPIVLRSVDGQRVSGKLRCISLTGGLVKPVSFLPPGSLVSLIFVTLKGPIVGTATMLHPVSWKEQPFRFVSVLDSHQDRLRAMIRSARRIV